MMWSVPWVPMVIGTPERYPAARVGTDCVPSVTVGVGLTPAGLLRGYLLCWSVGTGGLPAAKFKIVSIEGIEKLPEKLIPVIN